MEAKMDIPKFLDLAADLETQLSMLYDTIAERSGDPPIATRLKTLANEELNHANVLRRGKRYFEGLPDLFTGFTMDDNEAGAGLKEAKIFHASLSQSKIPLLDRLKKMLKLEKRFEKIHMGASVKITEPSLQKLFATLTKGDQSHILVLKGLIESFGEDV
jgi:rubrerythrin